MIEHPVAAVGMHPRTSLLSCERLSVAAGERCLVRELMLSAQAGRVICVLGRNGTGKTLTLHTLAGLRPAASGRVLIGAENLEAWSRRELATRLALLTQHGDEAFPSTVLETALSGRHPHIGFWHWESDEDRRMARAALAAVDLNGLEDRDVSTLSGGERRRVAIATVLAQDPAIFLLDEPANHLDPHHLLDVLRLFRRLADQGRTVLMSLHDAGLAARFADEALLLFGDGRWLHGPVAQVLTEKNIGALYGVSVRELRWEGGRTFVSS